MNAIAASSRAAARSKERELKILEKQQLTMDALEAIDKWNSYTERLVSFHKNLCAKSPWSDFFRNSPRPPEKSLDAQTKARQKLDTFTPSIFDKLYGGSKKRHAMLKLALNKAIDRDNSTDKKKTLQYETDLQHHSIEKPFADKLRIGDPEAVTKVIEEARQRSKDSVFECNVGMDLSSNPLHSVATLSSNEIIPTFRLKQLASGKLSETKMPVGQFNELYQDYVSSMAFKVAGDLFRLLPLEEVLVTCISEMLDPTTGHKLPTPILSVKFIRKTFEGLNMNSIDPSDALNNFNHIMNFKRTKGFAKIEPLRPIE